MDVSSVQFNCLLAWLDSDPERAGEKYLTLTNGLVQFFSRRHCNGRERCPHGDDLARETLDRVASKIDENRERYPGAPDRCVYGYAKFIWKEHLRDHIHEELDQSQAEMASQPSPDSTLEEIYLQCLEVCLRRLAERERTLAVGYFSFTGRERINRRKKLAEELGITMGNLAVKALQVRRNLKACVTSCSDNSLENQLINSPHQA